MGAITFRPITLAEFEGMPEVDGKQEVNEGELLTMPPAQLAHARLALAIMKVLINHLQDSDLEVFPELGCLLCKDPLTYRQPDISVVSKAQLHDTAACYFEGSPELAIEVVSPSDSVAEMQAKAAQYLEHGAFQVWVVYPSSKTVHRFKSDGAVGVLDVSDSVEVAGVAIPLARFFDL